jgi:hypothetical protein
MERAEFGYFQRPHSRVVIAKSIGVNVTAKRQ